jgi:hypothetical protein
MRMRLHVESLAGPEQLRSKLLKEDKRADHALMN